MSTLPNKGVQRLEWFELRVPVWTANLTAVGLISADTTQLASLTTSTRTAYEEQQAAMAVAKAKTLAYQQSLQQLSDAGSLAIEKIRVKARSVGGTSVYSIAQIPPPATPGPCGPLGTPSDFWAKFQLTGQLEIGWKNTNPKSATGVVYQVYRRSSPTGEFEYLGGSGDKKFLDSTIPAGSSQVTYQIQAVRSTTAGAWAWFNVNFGIGGGTTVTAMPEATKIAA